MDVGARLREARQRQGLTLGDISASTKVPTRILALLEHNRFKQLPAGIVTRGYLRAYAAEVGVDPRPLVAHYLAERFGGADEHLPIAPPSPVEGDTPGGRHPLLETLVIVLAIVLFQLSRYAGMPVPAPSVETSASTAVPELASLRDAAVHDPLSATSKDASIKDIVGVQIDIRAAGPCWVSATADDRVVIYRLLKSGDRVVATARERLVLRVGDPETFEYWLNGVPGRRLGPPGRPVTVHITEGNYETYRADSVPEGSASSPIKTT